MILHLMIYGVKEAAKYYLTINISPLPTGVLARYILLLYSFSSLIKITSHISSLNAHGYKEKNRNELHVFVISLCYYQYKNL